MKIIKIAVLCLIAFVLIALAADFCVRRQFAKSVDSPSGSITLSGLKSPVTIRRDRMGVPYIEAACEDDLFFATGYVSASDRLWQMTVMKMAIQGRMSEILGKDGMQIDLMTRSLGVDAIIDDSMKRMDARSIRILESYSRGVNAYVDSHENLPAEFFLTRYRPEPWAPRDSLHVFAMMTLTLSFNFMEELDFLNLAARVGYEKAAWLMPVYPDENLPFDEAKKLSGIDPRELNSLVAGLDAIRDNLSRFMSMGMPASNNWALSGAKTKSGKPIVCNDTHLEDPDAQCLDDDAPEMPHL